MNNKLVNIQCCRLFACVAVFIVHFGQRIKLSGILRHVTDFGANGVQLFFIISGFLIANSYYSYGNKNLKRFYIKKMLNILPLYYIVVVYYFIVHTFILKNVPIDPTGFGWIRYLIPVNGILPNTGMYFWDNLGITWTIPYFAFAYLVLPLCLKYINNIAKCSVLLLLTVVVSVSTELFKGWLTLLVDFPFFIVGLLIYFVLKENKKTETIVIASLVNILLLCTGLSSQYMSYVYGNIFVVLILSTMDYTYKSEKIEKLLKVSDKYSYTFYLAHGIVFIHCLDVLIWNRLLEAIIAVVGSLILTVFINNCIETPIKKYLNSNKK